MLMNVILRYPAEFIGGRIGIITPYKYQLSLLRSRLLNAFGSSIIADMEFNTVDGFQGREVDILLLSTVRAAQSSSAPTGISSSSIGFVADVRRMNVALTRAKLSLWILGNARTLQTNYNWAALVKDAKERNLIISAKMPYHKLFSTAFDSDLVEKSNNSANFARRQKHEKKVKSAGWNVTKSLVNEVDAFERKKECIAYEGGNRNIGNGSGSDSLGSGENVQCKKENARDEHVSIVEDTSSLVANCDKRTRDSMSIVSDQSVSNGGLKGKNKMMLRMGNTALGKRHHVKVPSGGGPKSKLSPSIRSISYGGNRRSCSVEDSAPSLEGCHKESDADDEGRARNQSIVSEISKRKKQREAVDAILYTSLISSKKSEPSKISAKRRFPSTVANESVKPPKTRNGNVYFDFAFNLV